MPQNLAKFFSLFETPKYTMCLVKNISTITLFPIQAMNANQEHHDLLVKAQSSSGNCKQMVTESDQLKDTSLKLLDEAKKMNILTRTHFTELKMLYDKLGILSQDFQGKYFLLSPCRAVGTCGKVWQLLSATFYHTTTRHLLYCLKF